MQKDIQNYEKGKFAQKSIVAQIDTKVIEQGSIGGKFKDWILYFIFFKKYKVVFII